MKKLQESPTQMKTERKNLCDASNEAVNFLSKQLSAKSR